MTFTEILKAKGIADDVIKAVQEDMKANKIYTASEENLDIRYGKLKTQHEGVTKQLGEANTLIEELKKSNTGNEQLQGKVTEYEDTIKQLQTQLAQTQIEAEAHVALLAGGVKAEDLDYVMFKLKAKGDLELGDDGKIKGMDDKIAALKTRLPNNFASESKRNIIENKLPGDAENNDGMTRESLLKKPYAERMKIYSENPEAYKTAMSK